MALQSPTEFCTEKRYDDLRCELQKFSKCGRAGLRRAHKGASFELQDLVILLLQVEPKELQDWQLVVEALFSNGAKDNATTAQNGNTERAQKNADAMAQYLNRNYSKNWRLPAFLPTARQIWSGGGRPGNAGRRGGRHRKVLDYALLAGGSKRVKTGAPVHEETAQSLTEQHTFVRAAPPLNLSMPHADAGPPASAPTHPAIEDANGTCCTVCKEPCGTVHCCDVCGKRNHIFCGIPIGDEGYGQPSRCHSCQPLPASDPVHAFAEQQQGSAFLPGAGPSAPPQASADEHAAQHGGLDNSFSGLLFGCLPQSGAREGTCAVTVLEPHARGHEMPSMPAPVRAPEASLGPGNAPAFQAASRAVLEQPCASGADHPHVDSMALVLRNVDDADAHISAGTDMESFAPVVGSGNHPASRRNLKSKKQCGKCKALHGSKKGGGHKGSICGKPVVVLKPDGSPEVDEDGQPVSMPCDFVFESVASRAMKQLQREVTLVGQARLPEPENMKATHVEKSFARLARKVESEARKEELDVFMAVIAPTFSSTSMQLGTTRTRHAEKLPITYDSSSIACLILRHATGPLSKQIFFHESVSRATEKMSCTAIAEMVKREELQRQATTAGAPSDANSLEGFLAKLGLSEHLQVLQSCGYDLDTLKRGSQPGAAFLITPDRLREDSKQCIPIGQCAKIILHAAELNQ